MRFSKMIHWVCKRRASISLWNACWLCVLHIIKWFESTLLHGFIVGFIRFSAVSFVLIGIFLPIVGIQAARKKVISYNSPYDEMLLVFQLILLPPLMAFDTVLLALRTL